MSEKPDLSLLVIGEKLILEVVEQLHHEFYKGKVIDVVRDGDDATDDYIDFEVFEDGDYHFKFTDICSIAVIKTQQPIVITQENVHSEQTVQEMIAGCEDSRKTPDNFEYETEDKIKKYIKVGNRIGFKVRSGASYLGKVKWLSSCGFKMIQDGNEYSIDFKELVKGKLYQAVDEDVDDKSEHQSETGEKIKKYIKVGKKICFQVKTLEQHLGTVVAMEALFFKLEYDNESFWIDYTHIVKGSLYDGIVEDSEEIEDITPIEDEVVERPELNTGDIYKITIKNESYTGKIYGIAKDSFYFQSINSKFQRVVNNSEIEKYEKQEGGVVERPEINMNDTFEIKTKYDSIYIGTIVEIHEDFFVLKSTKTGYKHSFKPKEIATCIKIESDVNKDQSFALIEKGNNIVFHTKDSYIHIGKVHENYGSGIVLKEFYDDRSYAFGAFENHQVYTYKGCNFDIDFSLIRVGMRLCIQINGFLYNTVKVLSYTLYDVEVELLENRKETISFAAITNLYKSVYEDKPQDFSSIKLDRNVAVRLKTNQLYLGYVVGATQMDFYLNCFDHKELRILHEDVEIYEAYPKTLTADFSGIASGIDVSLKTHDDEVSHFTIERYDLYNLYYIDADECFEISCSLDSIKNLQYHTDAEKDHSKTLEEINEVVKNKEKTTGEAINERLDDKYKRNQESKIDIGKTAQEYVHLDQLFTVICDGVKYSGKVFSVYKCGFHLIANQGNFSIMFEDVKEVSFVESVLIDMTVDHIKELYKHEEKKHEEKHETVWQKMNLEEKLKSGKVTCVNDVMPDAKLEVAKEPLEPGKVSTIYEDHFRRTFERSIEVNQQFLLIVNTMVYDATVESVYEKGFIVTSSQGWFYVIFEDVLSMYTPEKGPKEVKVKAVSKSEVLFPPSKEIGEKPEFRKIINIDSNFDICTEIDGTLEQFGASIYQIDEDGFYINSTYANQYILFDKVLDYHVDNEVLKMIEVKHMMRVIVTPKIEVEVEMNMDKHDDLVQSVYIAIQAYNSLLKNENDKSLVKGYDLIMCACMKLICNKIEAAKKDNISFINLHLDLTK